MTCEEYVIERVKDLEEAIKEYQKVIAEKEAENRKLEAENVSLRHEKEELCRILDPKVTKDVEGSLRVELPNLYGWSREDKPKIEKIMNIFGLAYESIKADKTGAEKYTVTDGKEHNDGSY